MWKYCQTPGLVLRLGVDFVLPLSQEQQEKEEEPSPKSYKRECTKSLKLKREVDTKDQALSSEYSNCLSVN